MIVNNVYIGTALKDLSEMFAGKEEDTNMIRIGFICLSIFCTVLITRTFIKYATESQIDLK